MTQLWLVPVDKESFQQTLAEPIDLSDAPDKPEEFPDQARIWGIRTDPAQGTWERNRRNLKHMEQGDPLLIYRNSQGRYTATGHVGPFWRTTHIREEYWNGGPAIDIYAVKNYREIDLDRDTLNRILGYKDNFWPQGLRRVADDRPVDNLLQRIE